MPDDRYGAFVGVGYADARVGHSHFRLVNDAPVAGRSSDQNGPQAEPQEPLILRRPRRRAAQPAAPERRYV